MNDISSIQTIGHSVNITDSASYQDNSQSVQKQSLSFQQSLTVEDGPLEINLLGVSNNEDPSVIQKLTQGITEVDADYLKIIDRLNSWPDFNGYLEKRGVSTENKMDQSVGITHISNIDEVQAASGDDPSLSTQDVLNEKYNKMESLQKEQLEYYSAGIEYSQDSTLWSMNSTFWLSKIKILTSAVSQVNSGLKTLFTSQ